MASVIFFVILILIENNATEPFTLVRITARHSFTYLFL